MHEASEGFPTILATSRTLALKPSEAKRAVAACVDSFVDASGRRGEVRLHLPDGARAVLHPTPLRGQSAGDRSRLTGTVRSRRGWVSVPVEIETAPVSDSCSELVVRPVGPICLRSPAHRRLFDRTSHALADFFRVEIEVAGLVVAPSRTPVARTVSPPVPLAV